MMDRYKQHILTQIEWLRQSDFYTREAIHFGGEMYAFLEEATAAFARAGAVPAS